MHALTLLFAIAACAAARSAAFFRDVSLQAGLDHSAGRLPRYGGPSVADLDGDGCPDIVFGYHTGGMEVYLNQCNGTFVNAGLGGRMDLHGILSTRLSAGDKSMHVVLSLGGSNGNVKRGPVILRVHPNRTIEDVSSAHRTADLAFRGRAALSVDLRRPGRPEWERGSQRLDLLLASSDLGVGEEDLAAFRMSRRGVLKRRNLRSDTFKYNIRLIAPVDADNDGRMDVLSLTEARVFSVTDDFTLTEITDSVFPYLPDGVPWHGVSAMAEADFNNDGLMDLYLGRTRTGDLQWRASVAGSENVTDVLLFGTADGGYRYGGGSSGVAVDLETRGVTTGDFDNDGCVDILLVTWEGGDVFLYNNCDGTFRAQQAGWRKTAGANGDSATAVDYDGDGRLDVLLCEGSYYAQGGGLSRLMRNELPDGGTLRAGARRNFLLVRVGGARTGRSSSLHAVVTVRAGDLRMVRRVGTPGVVISVSYIERVHFGLADNVVAQLVRVEWTDGSSEVRENVAANSLLEIGVF